MPVLPVGATPKMNDTPNSQNIELALSDSDIYKSGLSWSQRYIDAYKNDELWVNKNPTLSSYAGIYYSDNDNTPAYLEYKIICGNDDCGYVIVNINYIFNRIVSFLAFNIYWELQHYDNKSKLSIRYAKQIHNVRFSKILCHFFSFSILSKQ